MSEYERLWYAIGYTGICLAVLVTVRDLAMLAYMAARWTIRTLGRTLNRDGAERLLGAISGKVGA